MSGSLTPALRQITESISRTLRLGTRAVAEAYTERGKSIQASARAVAHAEQRGAAAIGDEARTVRQAHPLRASARDWGYRSSAAESAMAARRLTTPVEFSDDMFEIVLDSVTDVRKIRSDDGELNIYKPIRGEAYHPILPFPHTPGSLTNREIAAYRVDEILGFGRVPPTARTPGLIGPDGRPEGPGMIQQFVESTDAREVSDYPLVQQQQVAVLDYVIGAMDRHPGNYRTVEHGDRIDVVAIDHGWSFPINARPLEARMKSDFIAAQRGTTLEPQVLEAVRDADLGRLRPALGDAGLPPNAIDGALARLGAVRTQERIPADVRFY
ncbi:hypothetical protein ACWDOP_15020 [Nocardia sp. NPDC003693]